MAVKATRTNFNTITVTGLDPDCPMKEVRDRAGKYARWLQRQISNLFEQERTANGKLRPNSSGYNAFKARHGFDPRRGHKSGRLQSALRNRKLYRTKIAKRDRKVTITVHENVLRGIISYAKFYEEAKVRGTEILGFQKGWTSEARRFFRRCELKEDRKRRRGAA